MTDPEIDALAATFYAAFDNRDGRKPDDETLRAMFAEGATITRVLGKKVDRWTVDAFVMPRVAMLTDGTLTDFHEWETEAQTTVLDAIASRRSAYEKDGVLGGESYRGGGQKFIHLYRDNGRWRISAILWEDR